ncbi:hypothetical protein MTF65_21160 [Streptomyces sp. APSN-46.1]|uniref:hypothetical protein n=1 Tax=Streptomyces sp. APSN-46.1 TaxID=2929049 RepID=UPI001FB297F2|nr:hypothetical protein [Streptomyces sp. APSN-46.1]MCJ1679807.1 hypothetical protein [Streptomyces sp. APSN-46.1]
MFEYEMAHARHADLIREANEFRRAAEARKAHRASSRGKEPEGPVREARSRFARVA